MTTRPSEPEPLILLVEDEHDTADRVTRIMVTEVSDTEGTATT